MALKHIDCVKLFDLSFYDFQMHEFVGLISETKGFNFVVTPNVQHIAFLNNANQDFIACYKSANFTLCDSRVVQLLSKSVKKTHTKRYSW